MHRSTILLVVFSAVVGFAACAEADQPVASSDLASPEPNADQLAPFYNQYAQEGANADNDQNPSQNRAERSAYYGGGYYGGGYGGYGGGYGHHRGYYGGYPSYGGYHHRGYYGGGYPHYGGYHGGYYGHHRYY